MPEKYTPAAKYAIFNSGSRMRPLLVLTGYAAIRGDWREPRIVDAAILIEWFHKTSLVLDDILDEDDYRKGRPTLHKAFGNKIALMNGLIMLCRGYDHLVAQAVKMDGKVVEIFREGLDRCLVGQAGDVSWDSRSGDLEAYLDTIAGKTAALSELAMRACGRIANGNERQTEALADYGFNLGMGYQILNDLKNVMGVESRLGKGSKRDVDLNRPNIYWALAVDDGWTESNLEKKPEMKRLLIERSRAMAEEYLGKCRQSLLDSRDEFHAEFIECLLFLVSEVKNVWSLVDHDIVNA